MDGKRATQVEVAHHRRIPRRVRPPAVLARPWAVVLGLGWPLAYLAMEALEPAPADPQAAPPLASAVLATGLVAGLLLTSAAGGVRHPLAAPAGVATGLLLLVSSLTCPATGHHAVGGWWFAQLAVVAVMLAVSVAALGSRARPPA